MVKHFDGIQLGLTATPCVAAAEVLASLDVDNRAFLRDTLRFFELDRPTYRYTLKQAIAEGYLVPYRIYHAITVKTAAEDGFPVRRDELGWSAMDAATLAEFKALFGGDDTIIVDPNALERRFTIPERNRAIVREFRDVLLNGYTGKDGVRRFPQDGKTIVFAVTKRHAATLAMMLDEAFADRKPSPDARYADYVVSEAGAEDTADARTKIKRFEKEAFPHILVSVNMLDQWCKILLLVSEREPSSSIFMLVPVVKRGSGRSATPRCRTIGATCSGGSRRACQPSARRTARRAPPRRWCRSRSESGQWAAAASACRWIAAAM